MESSYVKTCKLFHLNKYHEEFILKFQINVEDSSEYFEVINLHIKHEGTCHSLGCVLNCQSYELNHNLTRLTFLFS